ncbi:MAG: 30S ribosomal protein S20 [Gemmatimonadales bacterium]|nr:30S ribosomal protein S20 [Gemmatimonadales bacterium]
MPQTKSAKKRERQRQRRTENNKAQRSRIRRAVKRVRTAATPEEAQVALAEAEKLLDRGGRKHLLHPNAAKRTKSRLAKAAGKS